VEFWNGRMWKWGEVGADRENGHAAAGTLIFGKKPAIFALTQPSFGLQIDILSMVLGCTDRVLRVGSGSVGQVLEIRRCLGMVRRQIQGAEKVLAGLGGVALPGLHDAEVVPAVGIVGGETQGFTLLIDGEGEVAVAGEDLGEQSVQAGILGRDLDGRKQLFGGVVETA
jgi:hypothetical protein